MRTSLFYILATVKRLSVKIIRKCDVTRNIRLHVYVAGNIMENVFLNSRKYSKSKF